MKKCTLCLKAISPEKRRNKFCCRRCAASFNNTKYPKRTKNITKIACLGCKILFTPRNKKGIYCSHKCHLDVLQEKYIADWKSGKATGLSCGVVSNPVKRYLREKYHDKCCLCGWSVLNKHTNKVPLVADHIDGNWKNNTEENLRLICPNCDSLTTTYGGANRGKGRGTHWKRPRHKGV